MATQSLAELQATQRSIATARLTSDVANEREESLKATLQERTRTTGQENSPRTQNTVLDQEEARILADKENVLRGYDKTINEYEESIKNLENTIRRVRIGTTTAQAEGYKNLSRLEKALRQAKKNLGYTVEKKNESLKKYDTQLKAIKKSRETGYSYKDTLRAQKRKDNSGLSSEEQLQEAAARGDDDAAKKLKSRQLFESKAAFSTRVIPKYEGETTGLKSGAYTSPLTGKTVIVREGGANTLPKNAQAKYTSPVKQAPNLWTRDYTVYAKVGGNEYRKEEPKTETKPVLKTESESKPPSNLNYYAPPESVGAEYFTNSFDNSTTPFISDTKFENARFKLGKGVLQEEKNQPLLLQSRRNIGKGISEFQEGEYATGALRIYAGTGQRFTAGLVSGTKNIIENPEEAALIYGVYAGSAVVAGPAGPALVFSAQNTYEFTTGQEPTIVKAGKDPAYFLGEITPFLGIEAIRTTTTSAVKSRKATEELKGEFASQKLTEFEPFKDTSLSVEIRGEPVTAIVQRASSVEQAGVKRTAGIQYARFGEPVYLTEKQINRLPWTFLSDTTIRQAATTKKVSGSQEGLTVDGIEFISTTTQAKGRATIQQIQEATIPVFRTDVRASDTAPGTITLGRKQAVTTFKPYEPPATSEVTTPKAAETTGARASKQGLEKKGGQLNEPPRKLDFFEEFTLEQQGTSLTIRESPYTGARDVTFTPFVITEVLARPSAKAKAASTGSSSGSGSIIEVDVPQSDGTVKVQSFKVDFEPPKTETKQQTKTVNKTVQQQRTEAAQKQPVGFQQYTFTSEKGVSLNEAIVKFGSVGQAVKGRQKKLSSLLSGQRARQGTAQAQGTKQAQASGQVLDFAQQQEQAVAFSQGQQLARVQQQRQRQALNLDFGVASLRSSAGNTFLQSETLKPVIPIKPRNNDKRFSNSFGVSVKRGGKFQQVGTGLSFKEAALKGALVTGSTAAASFKITGTGQESKDVLGIVGARFGKSKRSKGVFVEKNKFRIDTPGEIGEISRKGQAVKRTKKNSLRGKFKWGF